jgi:cytochrome c biogenesis protein CcdA
MERHPTDFVELLFGLAFMAAGAGFIVHQTTDSSFDAAWIAAIALVTIGCAFLAVTLLRGPRREHRIEAALDIPTPVDEPVEDPQA